MASVSDISPCAGGFRVAGELRFGTVPVLLRQAQDLFGAGAGAIDVDFSGVTRVDSAALALLLEWMRLARRQQREIVFRNLPQPMVAMARVSGLEDLLPRADRGQIAQ